MSSPLAIALADQLQAEVTDKGNAHVRQMCAAGGVTFTEDEMLAAEIGVQAGYLAALNALVGRGWLQVPTP